MERVLKYGTNFETNLINMQKDNPQFSFLTDFNSADHAYYRWKVYSLKNGDLTYWWRLQPFLMFENGPVWSPPKITFQENVRFQYFEFYRHCI